MPGKNAKYPEILGNQQMTLEELFSFFKDNDINLNISCGNLAKDRSDYTYFFAMVTSGATQVVGIGRSNDLLTALLAAIDGIPVAEARRADDLVRSTEDVKKNRELFYSSVSSISLSKIKRKTKLTLDDL